MRRCLLLTCLLAVLVSAAPAAAATTPTASLSVDACGTVTAKKQTGVTFSGAMEYLDDADTMSMRFELLTRLPGETAFTRVPDTDETVRRKAVKLYRYGPRTFVLPDLNTAADYRARITFRWIDADGRTLDTERRTSAVCRLMPQANLSLGTLSTGAGAQPGMLRYTIAVRNGGHADAGTFDVGLRIGAEDRPPVTVTGVAAGAGQSVSFTAPRCAAGDVLRFEVDPDGRVAEEDERDNVLTVACPSVG